VHWLPWDWITDPGLASTRSGSTKDTLIWDYYKDFQGVVVLSMSMAGNSNVERGQYENNMRACAKGDYNGYWHTFADNATKRGRTDQNTVVSLAHEFNGTWFKWHPGNVGLDVWKSCWRNVYTAIKAKSSIRIVWVFSATTNSTKGGDFSVATAWDAWPGDQYVDIIGVNHYDFRNLGTKESTDWRDSCGHTQDICHAAKMAREKGKPVAVPEWSSDRNQYGYGDNPNIVNKMWNFFKDNRDILAFENMFNNGGSGAWHVYPRDSSNQTTVLIPLRV